MRAGNPPSPTPSACFPLRVSFQAGCLVPAPARQGACPAGRSRGRGREPPLLCSAGPRRPGEPTPTGKAGELASGACAGLFWSTKGGGRGRALQSGRISGAAVPSSGFILSTVLLPDVWLPCARPAAAGRVGLGHREESGPGARSREGASTPPEGPRRRRGQWRGPDLPGREPRGSPGEGGAWPRRPPCSQTRSPAAAPTAARLGPGGAVPCRPVREVPEPGRPRGLPAVSGPRAESGPGRPVRGSIFRTPWGSVPDLWRPGPCHGRGLRAQRSLCLAYFLSPPRRGRVQGPQRPSHRALPVPSDKGSPGPLGAGSHRARTRTWSGTGRPRQDGGDGGPFSTRLLGNVAAGPGTPYSSALARGAG